MYSERRLNEAAAQTNFPPFALHARTLFERMHSGNSIIKLHNTWAEHASIKTQFIEMSLNYKKKLHFPHQWPWSQSCKTSHISPYQTAASGVRQRCSSGSMATWGAAALMYSSPSWQKRFVIFGRKESLCRHKSCPRRNLWSSRRRPETLTWRKQEACPQPRTALCVCTCI